MNMDQRSKLLNTEMGIVANSPDLAAAVADYFERAVQPRNAYRVDLENNSIHGSLLWHSVDDQGQPTVVRHEPDVPLKRRVEVDMLRMLPIDGLL